MRGKPGINYEGEEALDSIVSILDKNRILTLSTFDRRGNQPCSCSAHYAFDDQLNLYIWTNPESLHGRNMRKNPKVAINIADSSQAWSTLVRGVQMFGTADRVKESELEKAGSLYLKRFPAASGFAGGNFNSKKSGLRMFKIKTKKIKLLDGSVAWAGTGY